MRLRDKTVYVLDAFSLIFREFHGMHQAAFVSPKGLPTGAIMGFVRAILSLRKKRNPDYLICAFDSPGKTFRHEFETGYKADRAEMPADLRLQIPEIKRVLKAFDILVLEKEGYEADDILAFLAKEISAEGGSGYLVTGDKDCRQLITEKIAIYDIYKDLDYTANELLESWGITPEQVIDYQALVGDKADCIQGVPLIGPKMAKELILEHGTLDEILFYAQNEVDRLKASGKKIPKKLGNLVEYKDQALISKKLVRLESDLGMAIDWEQAEFGNFDTVSLVEIFDEYNYGFHQFKEEVSKLGDGGGPPLWQANYQNIDTPEKFETFYNDLKQQKNFSFDTETTSVLPRFANLVGLSFCWEEGKGYYIPVKGPLGEKVLEVKLVLEKLKPIFENPNVLKTGQNLKYDCVVLKNYNVDVQGLAFDTMLASYLLEAGRQSHGLNALSSRYLGHEPVKIEELIGKGKNEISMDLVPVDKVAYYAAEDADIPQRLRPILADRLAKEGLEPLFEKLEMPLIEVLIELEHNGIHLDAALLKKQSTLYEGKLEVLEQEIYQLAHKNFNIASPKQLQVVLFDELGLPVIKKTKTGASTDAEVLEQLAKQHDLPRKIIEYRQLAKLKSTYLDSLPKLIHPETRRVHTSFNQVVAATGRLSSNDPNLQNIPIRTEEGREIRRAFLPGSDDWQLLSADYSQIELRVLAHFCGDEALQKAFANDEDIHARVASEVYKVELEEVTKEMRRNAKAVNFGIIYGQSAFGLAKGLDISQGEAADFIEAYFDTYPRVEAFMDQVLVECREQGFVTTITGRKREIAGVREPAVFRKSPQKNMAERTAINTVIQGSAADIIKQAMLDVHSALSNSDLHANMLLQIHDELLFESPIIELPALSGLVEKNMIQVEKAKMIGKLSVPLKVDIKVGKNWADCE